MPYEITNQGNAFVVKTKGKGGKVHGVHSTHSKAKAQMKALYANTPASDFEANDTPQHEKSETSKERKAEGE